MKFVEAGPEKPIARLESYLARFRDRGIKNFIDGQWCDPISKESFATYSPVDRSLICQIARASATDIDKAAKAAKASFLQWRDMPADKRKTILNRIADGIKARAEEIALCECWDTGQPIRYMAKAALRGAENFCYFAEKVGSARDGQSLPSSNLMNITTRQPIGPVGVITPWNTPFMLSTWKIAPALAAGCTIVHKPAELSPITASILMEIAEHAGLPKGVWNLINGYGEDTGKTLTEHPDIKAIAFVGESRTGSLIMRQGADTLKRCHFELGGKNPVIIFDDCDLERALDAVLFMIYSLNGERCTSSSRLLLQSSIAKDFIARLIARIENIQLGHPLDPNTEIGPLIHQEHVDKVTSYFEIAKKEGATIAAGGTRPDSKGLYVAPTLLTHAQPDMRISREEIFGPILTALTFEREEEALEIANNTRYGLTGYIWTNDLERSLRFSHALDAGMIWVNSENIRHLSTPFGGMKDSGIGRDGGDWSFDFYMEQKNIALATGRHPIPKLGVAG